MVSIVRSSHQQVESIFPPLDLGLAMRFALASVTLANMTQKRLGERAYAFHLPSLAVGSSSASTTTMPTSLD